MVYKVDERGSINQRILYDFLHEIYPTSEIIYEYPLYELNQRIDIYIPNLGIAVEYNGEAHYHFIPHFHKTIEDFKYGLELDRRKREYLYLHGVKVVDIKYNEMLKTSEDLRLLISSIDYPKDVSFIPLPNTSQSSLDFMNIQKERRKQDYLVKKELYKEDDFEKNQRLEKQKQFRKDLYQKQKQARKK